MKSLLLPLTYCCLLFPLSFVSANSVQNSAMDKCHKALIAKGGNVAAMPICKVEADKGDKLGHFYYAMAILKEQLPFQDALFTDTGWLEPTTHQLNEQNIQWIREAEKQFRQSASKGFDEANYQLGLLTVHTKSVAALNKGSSKKRLRRGLFYFVSAADNNHKGAIEALSNYVKSKMVDGKMPLNLTHYTAYVEMDWVNKGKSDKHHHAAYERWLTQVEQTRLAPQKLDGKVLSQMAKDYENGYFLGEDTQKALELYQIAADKDDALGQFKTGDLLYPTNKTLALFYLRKSAKNQWADAMMRLGDHFGCLGKKDQALQWYEQALAKGHEYAADEKASMLDTGKPTQCD